jgi:hypothetical protein
VRVPPPPFATLRGLAVASRTRPTRDEVTLPRFHQTSRTAIYVTPGDKHVATQGDFNDSQRVYSAFDPPADAEPPATGAFTFGVWNFTRKWNGYREIELAAGTVRRIPLAEVAERFRQAVEDGEAFPFLHDWTYRTLGWEWRPSACALPAGEWEGARFAALLASLLSGYVAVAAECAPQDLSVAGVVDGSRLALRVLDGAPGGNGMTEALLHDGRMKSALRELTRAVRQCGDEKAFELLCQRRTGEQPSFRLKEVLDACVALERSWG